MTQNDLFGQAELLAKESPVQADVVIGVPDSGIDAAIGCFTGNYPIPVPTQVYKNKFEEKPNGKIFRKGFSQSNAVTFS